jgi:hypothetical protein
MTPLTVASIGNPPVKALDATITHDVLHLSLDDGNELRVPVDALSRRLASATPEERRYVVIQSRGSGLHWPLIDEDLSVSGIVRDHGERANQD